jgi:ATP adenylyltransferase
MEYIKSELKGRKGCFLCRALKNKNNPKSLIIYAGKTSFVILNKFPYNSGHLMIAPFLHVPSLSDLDTDTKLEMLDLVSMSCEALNETSTPQGFNVGINLGRIAGAGLEDHIHIHLVPRWAGDTNFMPILGEAKVIPEHLLATRDKLKTLFQKVAKSFKNSRKVSKIHKNTGT